MLRLARDEIHLWFVYCDEIADTALLARYRRLLSNAETEQELRFHAPADRHRYLLTRALVRTVLSRYSPLPAESWIFANDRHGRPHIANQGPGVADICFNISHTRGLVLLGITSQAALGVDVESIRERTPALELAERYFSHAEARSLRALPPGAQLARFFDFWTLKESYIKARGKGLSIPLDGFGFGIRGQQLSFEVRPELGDDAGRWRFWLLSPSAGYITAVCAGRAAAGEQVLITRKTVPLSDELDLHCTELGKSP
ncbi:MAG: 4'-phosphopantetheinyl transferase family protein [Steroidobacteraceae bacterium]